MCEGIVPRPVKNEDDQVTDIENEHQVSYSKSGARLASVEAEY